MEREKSAGAVIFHRIGKQIKYLILHYESGHWDFPRGHIEHGEKELETAAREIKEETGIDKVNFIPGFRYVYSWFFRKKFGKRSVLISKTAILYLAETKANKVKISHEHIGYKWLTFGKAMEELTFDNSKKIIGKAHNFLTRKAADVPAKHAGTPHRKIQA